MAVPVYIYMDVWPDTQRNAVFGLSLLHKHEVTVPLVGILNILIIGGRCRS